jgi:hypothetical protein
MFYSDRVRVRVIVCITTFNNISVISWWSVLLVEEISVLGENYQPFVSHWQTNVVLSAPCHEWDSNSQIVIGFFSDENKSVVNILYAYWSLPLLIFLKPYEIINIVSWEYIYILTCFMFVVRKLQDFLRVYKAHMRWLFITFLFSFF